MTKNEAIARTEAVIRRFFLINKYLNCIFKLISKKNRGNE